MNEVITAEQLFERIVLNALMNDRQYFSKVLGILDASYFTEDRKEIFKLLKGHYLEHQQPGSIADIAIRIKNLQNQDHKALIVKELKEVSKTQVPTSLEAMLNETLQFAKDALYLKALEVGSEGLMLKSESKKKEAERILDERAKLNIETDLGIEFSDASAVIDYYSEVLSGLLTQHHSLNERLGPGFLPGTLSLILAASGVGKSLLMTDLISGYIKQGKNILLLSLEMSAEEVMKRVHSNVLNIPMIEFLPHNFDKEKFIRKIQDGKRQGYGTFFAKDYPALSFGALQLESILESFKNEKGLTFDAVFVDYLGIMKSDLISPSAGLYSYVKSIAEEVRAVAKRNKVAIISAQQLNRGATNNTDADNASVSDSYGTVMTADFMMFLLQTEEMKSNGDIIAKITKNRFSGRTESFPMKVDYNYMRFYDVEVPQIDSARNDFLETLEANIRATDEQFNAIQSQDAELARKLDEANARAAKNNKSNNSLESILEDLL